MLLLLWGLWCLTALMQGGTGLATFLPPSMEKLFRDFNNIMQQSREELGKEKLETSVDFSKLPPNYHNEENKQRKVGNATVYSRHEISKVTDNRTGEMLFSEKTVTSIEQGEAHHKEKDQKPVASQKEQSPEAGKHTVGLRFFRSSPPEPKLTFLVFRFPRRFRSEQMPKANWVKEEPVSDRRHRLLAIRNGLLTVPRPIKKKVLPVTPRHELIPQKRHFFFFWRKI